MSNEPNDGRVDRRRPDLQRPAADFSKWFRLLADQDPSQRIHVLRGPGVDPRRILELRRIRQPPRLEPPGRRQEDSGGQLDGPVRRPDPLRRQSGFESQRPPDQWLARATEAEGHRSQPAAAARCKNTSVV